MRVVIILLALLVGPVWADHYRYYKVKPGDTLVSIALQCGVDRGVIASMNPQLNGGALEPGSIICVPDPSYDPGEARPAPRPEPKPVAKEPVKVEISTDADDSELDLLARYAVSGEVPEQAAEEHRNVFINSKGEVIEVPTAQGKEAHTERLEANAAATQRRRQLSSRRGKALFGLLKTSRSLMGVPYVWGGESPKGADCSGYVQLVFARHGIKLPRTADVQFNAGTRVEKGKEQPGDLVFFETYAPGASHVGIYLGQDKFIHASSRAGQVTINALSEPYFSKRYLGARRNL